MKDDPDVTGLDLRAERVRVGLRQADIARLIGVSRSRVDTVEALRRPSKAWVRRYLDAVRDGRRP